MRFLTRDLNADSMFRWMRVGRFSEDLRIRERVVMKPDCLSFMRKSIPVSAQMPEARPNSVTRPQIVSLKSSSREMGSPNDELHSSKFRHAPHRDMVLLSRCHQMELRRSAVGGFFVSLQPRMSFQDPGFSDAAGFSSHRIRGFWILVVRVWTSCPTITMTS